MDIVISISLRMARILQSFDHTEYTRDNVIYVMFGLINQIMLFIEVF